LPAIIICAIVSALHIKKFLRRLREFFARPRGFRLALCASLVAVPGIARAADCGPTLTASPSGNPANPTTDLHAANDEQIVVEADDAQVTRAGDALLEGRVILRQAGRELSADHVEYHKESGDFAMRGNVIDLAIGVIIGAAFGKIVTSLVNDVIMPPIGLLLGSVDFSNLFVNLHGDYATVAAAEAAGAPIVKYGIFINNVIDFLIVAFVIFLVIRTINQFKRKQEAAPPPGPSAQEKLLMDIRDLLKGQNR